MLKVIHDLDSIMVDTRGNITEAARRLGANRGAVAPKVHAKENAYIVLENGDVYKRTGKKYLPN